MPNDDRSLLTDMEALGVAKDTKVANLFDSAQLGVGFQPKGLDAATPIVFPPTFLVVLSTPTMYESKYPKFGQMIKSLIEGQPKSVTGIDFNYTLETAEQPVGHDGQNQEVPTRTVRSAAAPSFTFGEVTGNLVWNLFRKWMWDIHHPDTNASMNEILEGDQVKPFIMSTYSMTMLAIQFDSTMLPENIIDGVYYTNMFPKAIGDLGLERTIGTTKTVERTVEFSSIIHHNDYTRELAKTVATSLQLAKVQYSKIKTGVTDVSSDISESGLAQQVRDVLAYSIGGSETG